MLLPLYDTHTNYGTVDVLDTDTGEILSNVEGSASSGLPFSFVCSKRKLGYCYGENTFYFNGYIYPIEWGRPLGMGLFDTGAILYFGQGQSLVFKMDGTGYFVSGNYRKGFLGDECDMIAFMRLCSMY